MIFDRSKLTAKQYMNGWLIFFQHYSDNSCFFSCKIGNQETTR